MFTPSVPRTCLSCLFTLYTSHTLGHTLRTLGLGYNKVGAPGAASLERLQSTLKWKNLELAK